jgi:murein DD-endopeptidase MepM/ murein hydrolase activator NlpD
MCMNNRLRNINSRKKAVKREKIIMLVSSAFVMAALTATGIYLKNKTEKERHDEYNVDFGQMENSVSDKYADLTEGMEEVKPELQTPIELAVEETPILDDEMDYMPLESSLIGESEVTAVGSGQIENPEIVKEADLNVVEEEIPTAAENVLSFSEGVGLVRPVDGEVLMHYNMENTVYFKTLDQYKYNPAVVFAAGEGSPVTACADGQIVKIYNNEEIGASVVLDLGNGYEAIYGQLATYSVGIGDYVEAGQIFATVGRPTKYFVEEGFNLYFSLEKDGVAVNPEGMFLP